MAPQRFEPVGEHSPFTIVLPALDEERGLLTTLEELRRALHGSGRTFEIVVVDDGSTDLTSGVVQGEGMKLIRHSRTLGYGASLKDGIRAAMYPLVVVMDADGTYPAAAIPLLADACQTADMVVGARRGPCLRSGMARGTVKWCFRQFAQWITGASIPDLNSGLRAFHRGVAERFMAVLPDGFSFTTTITVSCLLEGLAVRFQGVDYRPRIGRSKIRPVRDTLRIGRQLLRLGILLSPLRTALALALTFAVMFAATSMWDLVQLERIPPAAFWWLGASSATFGAGLAAELRVRRRRSVTGELATPRGP